MICMMHIGWQAQKHSSWPNARPKKPLLPRRAGLRGPSLVKQEALVGVSLRANIDETESVATFNSVEEVFDWCDPHRERIWEEPSDADEASS
jgi:hypothetical protein